MNDTGQRLAQTCVRMRNEHDPELADGPVADERETNRLGTLPQPGGAT